MDLYHSQLTHDDLNELIIKYKIPCYLHPRLPSEDFVMFELSDDAIGMYHRIFDFSGVRIPFSSFLLALIKHYKVHFTQLGPLGLNNVITFEVLCRSLQIEPTVTLFRVFQTLCKQGDWFSFAKRRDLSPVCIDDNRSCMKHWKSGFFLIDRRAIPDYITWRHPDSAIEDPKPVAGSYRMANRLPFYCTPVAAVDVVVPNPTMEELAISNPSAKVIAKAEASQNSAMAQSSGSTARPNLFADDSGAESDDDDDACYEIPIVTPIRSAAVIPPSGNQSGGSAAPAVEGPNTRGFRGKGIMTDADAAVAPSVGASRPRVSSSPAPSFRELSRDAIHRDFFPISFGPYYATYPEGGIAGNYEFTREMVQIEALSSDQLTAKMSVLYCLMMSHGGEILAWYRGLLQSHHDYVQSTDSRLKGYQEKFASLTRLESQVFALQRQITRLNDKLSAFDALFAKSKVKGKKRKKKIKSLIKSLDNLHAEVARLFADLNRATVLEAEKDEEILRLKATPLAFASFFRGQFQALVWKFLDSDEFSRVYAELISLVASAGFERAQDRLAEASSWSFRLTMQKESTMTLASTSLDLLSNTVATSFAAALEPNEEWVNAMVDGPDNEMVDVAANAKPGDMFMQGVSHAVDDVIELTVTGSKHASFGPGDVVVPLSAGEKGDGSVPSSTIEEVVAPPSVA
ncbi:hypothetical protein Tco_1025265 [Tanacetum coccineum]